MSNLPEYVCHKRVRAAKILAIEDTDQGHVLIFEDSALGHHPVDKRWVREKRARPGGYLVVYEDGYESFSPAGAFEAGYHLVEDAQVTP